MSGLRIFCFHNSWVTTSGLQHGTRAARHLALLMLESPLIALLIHIVLHLLLPLVVAWLFFRDRWKRAWLIMLATMLVDLDHLAADPIFDPERCSVGFHLLHSCPAIGVYAAALFVPWVRLVGAGLLVHMVLDGLDCL